MKSFLQTLKVASLSFVAVLVLAGSSAGAAPVFVYDNIPNPQPGNLPSQAFEATGSSEFGGLIRLDGTERSGLSLKVLMSSWGCESGNWYNTDCVTTPGSTFSHSITAKVYTFDPLLQPATLIASSTKTFDIPYRPSTSPVCGDGRWSQDGTAATCFNGLATPIVFDTWNTSTAWPDDVIVSLSYNTSHYGYQPIGEAACFGESGGCGYDSLNVALTSPPTVGTTPIADGAYLNSQFASQYCDPNSTPGTFRFDAGCWAGYQPAYELFKENTTPQSKDDCKNNGWKTLTNSNGDPFKNQGQCVSYVTSNEKANKR